MITYLKENWSLDETRLREIASGETLGIYLNDDAINDFYDKFKDELWKNSNEMAKYLGEDSGLDILRHLSDDINLIVDSDFSLKCCMIVGVLPYILKKSLNFEINIKVKEKNHE